MISPVEGGVYAVAFTCMPQYINPWTSDHGLQPCINYHVSNLIWMNYHVAVEMELPFDEIHRIISDASTRTGIQVRTPSKADLAEYEFQKKCRLLRMELDKEIRQVAMEMVGDQL